MALPGFTNNGWLPEGHYEATWEEISQKLSGPSGSRRQKLLLRLLQWRDLLQGKGLKGTLVLNGSFVSNKAEPGDIDAIFVYDESTDTILRNDEEAQQLIDYSHCKESGLGDILVFPKVTLEKHPTLCRLDVFDYDRSGLAKGVLEVEI